MILLLACLFVCVRLCVFVRRLLVCLFVADVDVGCFSSVGCCFGYLIVGWLICC